jgi:hypothetical protein
MPAMISCATCTTCTWKWSGVSSKFSAN